MVSGRQDERDVLNTTDCPAIEHQATILHEQFVVLRRHRLDHRKLKLIDAAVRRLDRGEFGVCEECGDPIPPKRLQAVPWAAFCIACQDRFDLEEVQAEPDLLLTA